MADNEESIAESDVADEPEEILADDQKEENEGAENITEKQQEGEAETAADVIEGAEEQKAEAADEDLGEEEKVEKDETALVEDKTVDDSGGELSEIDNQHVEVVDAVPPADGDVIENVEKVDADDAAVEDIPVQADEEGHQEVAFQPPEEGGEQVKGEEQDEAVIEEKEEAPAADEPSDDAREEDQVTEDKEERSESPILGTEPVLSRQMSPASDIVQLERLEATSPDQSVLFDGSLEEIHKLEEEMMEPAETEPAPEPGLRREEIIEKYYETLAEKDILQQNNILLQQKLAEYFRKKKTDEKPDYEKNVSDQDQRYLKYMAQLEDLRRQYQVEKANYSQQIEDLKEKCQEKKEKVDTERRKFIEYKQDVAMHAIFGRSGKPIPPKDIEQYFASEAKKEQEVVNVRLEYIKLKHKLTKREKQLKSKEELADGLHLIDFEQLKIENQTYNEKIEERNEELLKLRKKITSTVQVLTHLKEKLQFVQGANADQNNELQEVESSLAKSRDILSRTKQARDALRIDNQRLRQNSGLLGNEPLLRDFEAQKDEASLFTSQIEKLKMRHAEMTLNCNQVRQKIDQAKATLE
ncbi:Coiled-coil domain-containing protein 96 [Bulinus truncatus]|nr:Coiled-coil domain-containing protein 96 [Bulinus truncatus]